MCYVLKASLLVHLTIAWHNATPLYIEHHHLHPVSFLSVFLISVELGFCEADITSDIDRGDHAWEETEVQSSDQTPCAFGPSNVQATRKCESKGFWAEPQIVMCGTQISRLFMEFNESAVSDDNSILAMKQIMLFQLFPY